MDTFINYGPILNNPELSTIWMFVCALLILLQQVGFLCLESGFVRSKNSINVAVKNLSDITLVLVCYAVFGHWLLTGQFLNIEQLPESLEPYNSFPSFLIFALYCATTMTIVSGPVAERMPIRPYLILGVVVSSILFPLLVKWSWTTEGWLNQLGAIDFAGGTIIHACAGSLALSCIIMVGPRRGRFESKEFKGSSNLGLSILGCIFLWLGWLGFNAGSFTQYHHNTGHVLWITLLSGALGGGLYLTWALLFNKTILVERLINCILAALVAITAAPHLLTSSQAVLFSIAGIFSYLLVSRLLIRFKLDDAIDAIGVHLGAGIIGTLLIPFITESANFVAQLVLILVVCFLSMATGFITLFVLKQLGIKLRVTESEEKQGLNVTEHNAQSDLYELINLMSYHQKTGDLSANIETDPYTEAGLITQHYNHTVQTIEKTKQELREQTTKAEKANRAKSEFLANMSHEIRTPMNGVLGMTQVLEKTSLNDDQKSIVDTIRNSGHLLMSIINDILDFSKIESNKLTLNKIECNIPELLENTVLNFRSLGQEKNLDIILDIEKLNLKWAKVDDVRLAQIIGNIIGNAVKFTQEGYISIRCESIHLEGERYLLKFAVTDTGVGIDPENIKKIFSPFEQEDTSTTRKFGGTGLGLTLCQSLAQLMGSEIKVSSEVGKGSTFSFDIECEALENQTEIGKTIGHKTLILVDDIELNHKVIKGLLKPQGVEIISFLSPKEALEEIIQRKEKQQEFDYLITDYMMPEMNGLQFYLKCKRYLPNGCSTMMLSSSNDLDVSEQATNIGITAFDQKPILEKRLLSFMSLKESAEANPITASPTQSNSVFLKHDNILVVEDNDINFMVIESPLQDLCKNIFRAEDGEQAIQVFKERSYDIVFMDCMLPGMDGITATRHIRQHEQDHSLPRTPIIALTADVTKENQLQCKDAGMDDFVSKPFPTDKIENMINKWALKK